MDNRMSTSSRIAGAPRWIPALCLLLLALATLASSASAASAAAAPAPSTSAPPAASDRSLRNLEALARLYGWVRWFHPSDEASAVDWDRMAVLGVERVAGAADDAALREGLTAVFQPVAPTLRLYHPGESPAPAPPPPPPASRWSTIAWQHRGLGVGGGQGVYESARLHRPHRRTDEASAGVGTITQALPADVLRGKRVRLRGAVRAEPAEPDSAAQLWLRVDRSGGGMGFFDNMDDRPIRSARWANYEIVGTVADDAERVVFGCLLKGNGKAWVDGVELAVEEGASWRPLAVKNGGFEAGDELVGWKAPAPGYRYTLAHEGSFEGKSALRIEDDAQLVDEPLFESAPALGEMQDGELVSGLRARLPLAVPGDAAGTWPPAGEDFANLQALLAGQRPESWSGNDWRVRAADVAILWNVYEHFYPYFDVVTVDWPAALRAGMRRALEDTDDRAFLVTLRSMVAKVQDGHGNVFNPALRKGVGYLPCVLDVIEGKVVVTAAAADAPLRRGDVLSTLDGESSLDQLATAAALRSGTPQWRQTSGLWSIGRGPIDRPVQVRVERDGATLALDVRRVEEPPPTDHSLEPATTLPGDVLYLDLTRLESDALKAQEGQLSKARAIVFDLRGYPRGRAQETLQHLTDQTLQSPIWQIPELIYPDHRGAAEWLSEGRWSLPPLAPRFHGKVAFLTGPTAISYSESILGIVEAYHLGAIVGANTAGTNGNVNTVPLPGGYTFVFTGMRVLKHDGSRHHLVGIKPTVPVVRTLAALRAGRDEEIEAALRAVGSGDGAHGDH